MGRRNDWTLRPELMRRKAVPVGNWPTVADIPPGMVVLDSDGVVKQKVGDYLIPVPVTIIGSGPLASAPVASAGNLGKMYLETGDPLWPNGRAYIYQYVYNPIGENTSDVLRLPLFSSLSLDWSMKVSFLDLDASIGAAQVFYVMSTGGGVRILQITRTSVDKFSFYIKDSNDTNVRVSATTANAVIPSKWNTLVIERTGAAINLSLNNGAPVSVSIGASWNTTGYLNSVFAAWSPLEKPAYVSSLSQCVDGSLCDYFPMTESAGTAAVNTIQSTRTGTYYQDSHAITLVPLDLRQ